MTNDPGIHDVRGQDPDALAGSLRASGWHVYQLPPNITDKHSFVVGVRGTIPLDPPVMSDHWDALSDSLGEGLFNSGHDQIAIVWPGSATMAKKARKDFENAHGILAHVARSLSDPEMTLGEPKTLTVLLT